MYYIDGEFRKGRSVIHKVKCYYCSSVFDRDKEEFVAVPGTARRYGHKKCYEKDLKDKGEIEKDKIALDNYIKQLFQVDYVPPLAQKQIKEFVAQYNYTYSGILKTLKYFYEIKRGDLSKARNGIGIVKYVYEEAYRYWRSLWEAQQVNKRALEKEKSKAKIQQVEIHITPPERKFMGRNIRNNFSFLDEEVKG